MGPYCAAKALLDYATRSYALEFAGRGVRFNSVLPGVIDTPTFQAVGLTSEDVQRIRGPLHPVGRIGRPEEVREKVTSDK
jgi:NAD(P)-dependent dehydrogenase (short-subunit alcohol dehydrogenase family)